MTSTHPFCTVCGGRCEDRIPEDDHRVRSVCTDCGNIHYSNPKVVVGCIVESEGKLLLARRNIEPALGKWTFPAGYLENGEGTYEGAARETFEETEARTSLLGLHAVLDIPHIAQMYTVFRARLEGTHFAPTPESQVVELVDPEDIPWDDLAFPSVATALRLWDEDRRSGHHRVHIGSIVWSGEGSRFDLAQYRLDGHRAH